MAHRDDTGTGPGRERQRLRHGGADRARAGVRPGRLRRPAQPPLLARLPLHGRVGRRRARRGRVRGAFARAAERDRGRQPRRRRGHGTAAARAGRRHGPLTVGKPRRDRACGAGRADRRRPGSREHPPPARRPRLPVQRVRAGALHHPRDPGGDDHHRPGPADGRLRRHAGTAEHRPARPGRPRDPERPRRDGAGARALARAVQLRLPRQQDRPRLGDRARAHRRAAALPRGDGRPVRALPAPSHPRHAGVAQLSQPPRLLGLVRRRRRAVLAARDLAARPDAAAVARTASAGRPAG